MLFQYWRKSYSFLGIHLKLLLPTDESSMCHKIMWAMFHINRNEEKLCITDIVSPGLLINHILFKSLNG